MDNKTNNQSAPPLPHRPNDLKPDEIIEHEREHPMTARLEDKSRGESVEADAPRTHRTQTTVNTHAADLAIDSGLPAGLTPRLEDQVRGSHYWEKKHIPRFREIHQAKELNKQNPNN